MITRTFLALKISQSAATQMLAMARPLPELALPAQKLRLVRRSNLHLTIKFLGPTTDEQRARLTQALPQAVAGLRPIQARAAGLGAFPTPQRPRAIYAAVSPQAEIIALIERVEAQCVSLGFPAENRQPKPHITLARIKAPRANAKLAQWLENLAACPHDFGPVDGSALILYESQGQDGHSVYIERWNVNLGMS